MKSNTWMLPGKLNDLPQEVSVQFLFYLLSFLFPFLTTLQCRPSFSGSVLFDRQCSPKDDDMWCVCQCLSHCLLWANTDSLHLSELQQIHSNLPTWERACLCVFAASFHTFIIVFCVGSVCILADLGACVRLCVYVGDCCVCVWCNSTRRECLRARASIDAEMLYVPLSALMTCL